MRRLTPIAASLVAPVGGGWRPVPRTVARSTRVGPTKNQVAWRVVLERARVAVGERGAPSAEGPVSLSSRVTSVAVLARQVVR